MSFKKIIRRLLRATGYDVVHYRHTHHAIARRKWILDRYDVGLVLDVGANTGQFGQGLRDIGYDRRIVSFEPLPDAYALLSARARRDGGRWKACNIALGNAVGRSKIHVAGNSFSSSLLPMQPKHLHLAPESRFTGAVDIDVTTLDAIFEPDWRTDGSLYLKIDTQGYESQVLDGAANALQFVDTIQLEMSLVPLYEGEALFEEIYGRLIRSGYRLVAIEPGFSDAADGELLQLEGIFHRFGGAPGPRRPSTDDLR